MKPKKFSKEKIEARQTDKHKKHRFCINEAITAEYEGCSSIDTETGKLTNVNVYDPDSNLYFRMHLVVGRSRMHRHIATNGSEYFDIHGAKGYGRRGWNKQSGPWKVVEEVGYKRLNQNAKKVVEAVIASIVNG